MMMIHIYGMNNNIQLMNIPFEIVLFCSYFLLIKYYYAVNSSRFGGGVEGRISFLYGNRAVSMQKETKFKQVFHVIDVQSVIGNVI